MSNLEQIIKRDFFPDLLRLEAYKKLEEKGDLNKLSQIRRHMPSVLIKAT